MLSDNIIIELYELSQNMNWLNWLCIDLTLEWLWVQTLAEPNYTFFLLNLLLAKVRRARNQPHEGSLWGWKNNH